MSEDVEALIDRDDNHVAAPRQIGAVEPRAVGRAEGKRAAVQPYHHRPLRAVADARRPHAQGQAVLALWRGIGWAGEMLEFIAATEADARLWGLRDIGQRIACPGPGRRLARRHEAIRSGCVRAVWNALE